MSMSYWGVQVYGIWENELNFKTDEELEKVGLDLDERFEDYMEEKLKEKSHVFLAREYIEDDGYVCGFPAGYPWRDYTKGITKEKIEDTLYELYKPFINMTKEEFVGIMNEINTYNCG